MCPPPSSTIPSRGDPVRVANGVSVSISASRIYHVNSNCTDLERSARFYERLGLQRVTRTVPLRPQPGAAFGLDQVAWDAWIFHSDDGFDGLSLDLLEWTTPTPTGAPTGLDGEPGYNRLVFEVADLDGAVAAAVATGGSLVGGPVEAVGGAGAVRVAMVRDPDGVPVQLVAGSTNRIAHVVVNCLDVDVALAYYRDVLGLRPTGPVEHHRWPGALFGRPGDIEVATAMVADAGSRFTVALVQWLDPAPEGPVRVRGANELGLFRMAWSTGDCAADEAVVRAAGSVPFAPTGTLSVGEDMPLLLVLFWPGPNGECLELIEVTDRPGSLEAP